MKVWNLLLISFILICGCEKRIIVRYIEEPQNIFLFNRDFTPKNGDTFIKKENNNFEYYFFDEEDTKVIINRFTLKNSFNDAALYRMEEKDIKLFAPNYDKEKLENLVKNNFSLLKYSDTSLKKFQNKDISYLQNNKLEIKKISLLRWDTQKIALVELNDLPPFGESLIYRELRAIVIEENDFYEIIFFVKGERLE